MDELASEQEVLKSRIAAIESSSGSAGMGGSGEKGGGGGVQVGAEFEGRVAVVENAILRFQQRFDQVCISTSGCLPSCASDELRLGFLRTDILFEL